MQICPKHQVPMQLLLISSYCPLCDKQEEPEIRFEDLSAELKRVRLAKDVIAQITSNQLNAEAKVFIQFETVNKIGEIEEKPCSVCALGALVVSCLPLEGKKLSSTRALSRPIIHSILNSYFNSDQLDLIESAFELRAITDRYCSDKRLVELHKASDYAYYYKNVTERMLAIMQNIIDNNGTFVVPE